MPLKRFIIEMGMGVDQHGQEPTVAAANRIKELIYKQLQLVMDWT